MLKANVKVSVCVETDNHNPVNQLIANAIARQEDTRIANNIFHTSGGFYEYRLLEINLGRMSGMSSLAAEYVVNGVNVNGVHYKTGYISNIPANGFGTMRALPLRIDGDVFRRDNPPLFSKASSLKPENVRGLLGGVEVLIYDTPMKYTLQGRRQFEKTMEIIEEAYVQKRLPDLKLVVVLGS